MYKVGDFSKKTGVSIKTLRYYDEIELFKPLNIDTFTGYRYYTDSQIKDIELIIKLKELGLSLDNIKEYIRTKDINIIKKEKNKLDSIIDNISNFINNKYKEYTVGEYDYKKYIEINGIKYSKCPQALEVRDKNAKYYVIYNKDEFIDDFVIFIHNDNWITLDRRKYLDSNYMDLIIDYLKKEGYKEISNYIPIEEEDVINALDKKFKNISKELKTLANFKYIKYKINI